MSPTEVTYKVNRTALRNDDRPPMVARRACMIFGLLLLSLQASWFRTMFDRALQCTCGTMTAFERTRI